MNVTPNEVSGRQWIADRPTMGSSSDVSNSLASVDSKLCSLLSATRLFSQGREASSEQAFQHNSTSATVFRSRRPL
jgi:hypothetical protein